METIIPEVSVEPKIVVEDSVPDKVIVNGNQKVVTRLVKSIKRRTGAIWKRIDWVLIRYMSRSGRLSSLYYAFFNRSFDREHRVVLLGRLSFEENRKNPYSTSSLLRRNIHRIEKGLLMKPRRQLFALDFIEETVEFFEHVLMSESAVVTKEELRWANDVLTNYFSVVGSNPKVDALRIRFKEISGHCLVRANDHKWVPYRRDLSLPPPVKYDDLKSLAVRRRSVRWFLPERVPRVLIEQAVAVASLSPSACNRQPFYFKVFDDPAVVQKIAALPGGTRGFSQQFPAVVVVVGQLRNYYGEHDRHLIYIDAALATMSFVFAAETLGLSTCCINWPDIDEAEEAAKVQLKLQPDERPIMFIAVGFPDPEGMVAYSQKKPVSQLCKYNFETN